MTAVASPGSPAWPGCGGVITARRLTRSRSGPDSRAAYLLRAVGEQAHWPGARGGVPGTDWI